MLSSGINPMDITTRSPAKNKKLKIFSVKIPLSSYTAQVCRRLPRPGKTWTRAPEISPKAIL